MATWVGLVDRDRYPEAAALSDEAIIDATKAILNWTDRDFLATQVTESRTFQAANDVSPSGLVIIDIDDADEVYDVDGFSEEAWREGTDGPAGSYGIATYIELATLRSASDLMGFTRNEDLFGTWWPGTITVSAKWGWPANTVPEDVQRATLITAYTLAGDTANLSGNLASKTVAEVSENYMQSAVFQQEQETLPRRAATLLDPWRRRSL
jgi:hypothetical protein